MIPEEQKLLDESITYVGLESKDLVSERVEQMKALFPEIVTESSGGGGSFSKPSTSKSYGSFWATR